MSWYDISTIEQISPAAALMLAAEFDTGRRLFGIRMSAIDIERWKPEVLAVFKQLGVLALLEVEEHQPLQSAEDGELIVLPFRTGEKIEGEEVNDLVSELAYVAVAATEPDSSLSVEEAKERFEKSAAVYHILIEAMNNVAEHAYRDVAGAAPSKIRHWWMTAAFNRRSRTLTVVMLDQGITIPVSLPHWDQYGRVEGIIERFKRWSQKENNDVNDGMIIAAAMKVAASATKESYRGKGFGRMKNFVDQCRGGQLRVTSRFGTFIHEKGRKGQYATNSAPVYGTLVEWVVSI